MNLLCFGYGQVAKNLVSNLLKKKVNLNLTISTRENSSIKKFPEGLILNLWKPGKLEVIFFWALFDIDHNFHLLKIFLYTSLNDFLKLFPTY